ncbi:MAG: D-isomer specific 2-hydroxyacid dehydrogenase family protein [Acidimicrobiia bacterium]|nr:D-isomer specific 2-hydroxyacid dehydrogenase family protein [Acidimicrobiia bacterium]
MGTTGTGPAAIAVEPKTGRYESLEEAVVAGGGSIVPIGAADALVWADPTVPHDLPEALRHGPNVSWVALPFAGIEPYVPYLDHDRVWTCARGVYARPVAEHVLALGLAGLRAVVHYARTPHWSAHAGRNLIDGNIVVFGAGGIAIELLRLLQGFECTTTVIRRKAEPMPGASRTVTLDQRLEVLPDADLVVLALALTPGTEGVISTAELDAMAQHAWLVNVARGAHIDTGALLQALDAGSIAGACLDVTDPEPLPGDHPLWSRPNVLITPHVGNTEEMGVPLLAAHIERNVGRFARGAPLEGIVDTEAGY